MPGTHYCFLPLLLPLLGPLGLPLLVVPAVLLPLQPLVLVLLITVIPAQESKHAVIAVLARPPNSPVPLTPMNKKIAGSHQGLGPMSSEQPVKRHVNKTSLRRVYDCGARWRGPRERRRATRSGSGPAAAVSTTSHVITFCLVRASSRGKVQLSPPPPPAPLTQTSRDASAPSRTAGGDSGLVC